MTFLINVNWYGSQNIAKKASTAIHENSTKIAVKIQLRLKRRKKLLFRGGNFYDYPLHGIVKNYLVSNS